MDTYFFYVGGRSSEEVSVPHLKVNALEVFLIKVTKGVSIEKVTIYGIGPCP